MKSKNEKIWVILRTSQYIRHLAVNAYFKSQVEALAYMEEHNLLKGAMPESLDLYLGEQS